HRGQRGRHASRTGGGRFRVREEALPQRGAARGDQPPLREHRRVSSRPPPVLPPRLGSALDELRQTLDRAAELARQIEARPPTLSDLEERLRDVQSDRQELSTKLAEYEHQVGRLMNLYVATYQLHATLDPNEVQATIAEIAINLLGAEKFALLFWKTDESGDCQIALSQGMEDDKSGLYSGGTYSGGDPAVDATLSDGVLRIGPIAGSDALACVPLTVQGTTVGALVILKLFDHKDS